MLMLSREDYERTRIEQEYVLAEIAMKEAWRQDRRAQFTFIAIGFVMGVATVALVLVAIWPTVIR